MTAKAAPPAAAGGLHAHVFQFHTVKALRHAFFVDFTGFGAIVHIGIGQPHFIFHLHSQHGTLLPVRFLQMSHQGGEGAAVRFQRGGAERAQRSHMPAVRPLSQTIRFGMQFDPFGHIIGMTVFAGAEPQQDQIQVVFPAKGQQVVHVGKIVLTGFPFQLIPVDGRFQQVAAVGLDRSQLPRHHFRVAHRGIMGLGTQQQQGLPLCICQKRHLSTLHAGLRAKIH